MKLITIAIDGHSSCGKSTMAKDLAKEIGVTKNYRGRTDIALNIDGKPKCPYFRIIIRRKRG